MKEMQSIVNEQVLKMCDSGEIQKAIEDGVKRSIDSAIAKQFESYGNITKQINKVFDEKLKVDTSEIDIPCYNQIMTIAINQKISEFFLDKAGKKLMDSMEGILSPLPSEMSIVEFVNKICEFWKTDEPWDCDDLDDYATVELITSENVSSWFDLKMWKKKESTYSHLSNRDLSEDVHLMINKDDGKIRLRHRWNPTSLYYEDAFIFKAYSSGMKLTGLDSFDPEDDCDLTLKGEC